MIHLFKDYEIDEKYEVLISYWHHPALLCNSEMKHYYQNDVLLKSDFNLKKIKDLGWLNLDQALNYWVQWGKLKKL